MLRDFKEFPEDVKKRLRKNIAAENAKTGPSKSIHSQVAKKSEQQKDKQQTPKTAGRLSTMDSSAACKITLKDDDATLPCMGRCDDGADDSLVSLGLAESAVLNGVGKLKKISPVTVHVALKNKSEAQTFTFPKVDCASPFPEPVRRAIRSFEPLFLWPRQALLRTTYLLVSRCWSTLGSIPSLCSRTAVLISMRRTARASYETRKSQ